jgi:F-type H+-transporting ATPase subunit a
MLDPLHQFVIKPIFSIDAAGFDLSFTNSSLSILLAILVMFAVFSIWTKTGKLIPSRMQALGELSYIFIADMIRDNVGSQGIKYFPFVFSIFLSVFLGNMLGMIPYAFTFTSHIIVTFTLAMIVFLFVTILGFVKHGWKFFSLFAPAGLPTYLTPLLVPIELISYLSRPITLAVRLFANMVAGHAMMKVFAGFSAMLIGFAVAQDGFASMVGVFSIIPLSLNIIMTGFEIIVAALQAYVFTILTCVYLNDAIHLH